MSFGEGKDLLEAHTAALFGTSPSHRSVRIMVTVPTQAANDYAFVRDLVAAGMDCMRINCAHDSRADWERMVINLRRAETELGRKCRIVDGPRGTRICALARWSRGHASSSSSPARLRSASVTAPARVGLFPKDAANHTRLTADAMLPVAARMACEVQARR